MRILIKNGTVIDPASGLDDKRDLLVEAGKVVAVEMPGQLDVAEVSQVVDAKGKWVTPGLVDLHVHLREPGFEWKETVKTGSEAAVLGGFTAICCMPNTSPANDCAEVTEYILDKARVANAARVLPIGAVSKALKGKEMAPLTELRRAGCVAFSDDGEPIYDAGLMRRSLEWCLALDATISCHEEDKSLSCGGCMNESSLSTKLGLKGMHKVAEDVMIARDIELARVTKGRVHICHVSSARGVELVRRAKNDGFLVTAEVTPHHLVLTEDLVQDYNTNAKMSPPLREQEDVLALHLGLKDGTIDAIASDHAPHDLDTKQVEFAKASFGILGLQTSLPLVVEMIKEHQLSRTRAFDLFTAGPCRAFKLELGRITKGATADITIIDPDFEWTFDKSLIRSLSYNNPFIGRRLTGVADTVMVGGRIVVQHRELLS